MKCISPLRRVLTSLLVSLLILGCTTNENDFEESEPLVTEIVSATEILLQKGIDPNNIIEIKDYYIEEGDVMFSTKNENHDHNEAIVSSKINNNSLERNNGSVYRRSAELVDVDGNRTITVYLPDDPLFMFPTENPSDGDIIDDFGDDGCNEGCPPTLENIWKQPLQMAMSDWNAANSCFTFILGGSGSDITILPIRGSSGFLGITSFPVNGEPYPIINVLAGRTDLNNNFAARRNLLAHELGHTIGFKHTGTFDGIELADGPSNTNGGSVMSRQNDLAGVASQGVSASDREALVDLCTLSNMTIEGPSEVCRNFYDVFITYTLTSGSASGWEVSSPNNLLDIVSQDNTSVTVKLEKSYFPFGQPLSIFGPTVEATIKATNSSGIVLNQKTTTLIGDPLNQLNLPINGPSSLNISQAGTFNVVNAGFSHYTSVGWSVYGDFGPTSEPSDDFSIQSNGFTAQITPLPSASAGNYIVIFKLSNDCLGLKSIIKSFTVQ